MEAAPVALAGILSGILQSGYSIGYPWQAIAARFLLPAWGWRPMFWIGALPRVTRAVHSHEVPESEAWKQHRAASTGQVLAHRCREWKRFGLSVRDDLHDVSLARHAGSLSGFLKEVHKISAAMVANIAMIYNVGAVVGAIIFGHFSQVAGRRKGMSRGFGIVALDDSAVGFCGGLQRSSPLPSDAGGSAGSMGRDPRASERAFRRRGARPDAGLAYQLEFSWRLRQIHSVCTHLHFAISEPLRASSW